MGTHAATCDSVVLVSCDEIFYSVCVVSVNVVQACLYSPALPVWFVADHGYIIRH